MSDTHFEDPATDDWYKVELERTLDCGRRACDAIEAMLVLLEQSGKERSSGQSLDELVDTFIGDGGRATRLAAAEAFHDYERSLAVMRTAVVRALVDDRGFTLTDVARRLSVSRQAVARMYHHGPT